MNELQVFNNPEFGAVRTLMIEDEPWAVGKDIAAALGYAKPTDAVRKHVDDEDRGISKMETPHGTQEMVIINESGIYSLILSSKLPSAKRFKRWVTSEVLPALRKTGKYAVPNTTSEESRLLTSDDYLTAARILSSCRNERLPYVLPLLQKAGIDIDLASGYQITKPARDLDGETARYIRLANEHGLSGGQISRLTGLHRNQISRIALGQSKPRRDRAEYIISVIKETLPELLDEIE